MVETQLLSGDPAADAVPEPDSPVLVLMHGRGADPSDLAPLRRFFPGRVAIVLVRAPFEAARWGYGPGWAWYLYEGEDRPEAESFRRSQQELEGLIEGIDEVLGAPAGPLFLGGFSQGGTMSLGYALRRPAGVAGVLNFSGFLPRHPDVPVGEADGGPPIFWGHGTADPAIPFSMALSGRERLRAAGLDVEARDYPMGHGISPEELRDASRWMEEVIARSGAS